MVASLLKQGWRLAGKSKAGRPTYVKAGSRPVSASTARKIGNGAVPSRLKGSADSIRRDSKKLARSQRKKINSKRKAAKRVLAGSKDKTARKSAKRTLKAQTRKLKAAQKQDKRSNKVDAKIGKKRADAASRFLSSLKGGTARDRVALKQLAREGKRKEVRRILNRIYSGKMGVAFSNPTVKARVDTAMKRIFA